MLESMQIFIASSPDEPFNVITDIHIMDYAHDEERYTIVVQAHCDDGLQRVITFTQRHDATEQAITYTSTDEYRDTWQTPNIREIVRNGQVYTLAYDAPDRAVLSTTTPAGLSIRASYRWMYGNWQPGTLSITPDKPIAQLHVDRIQRALNDVINAERPAQN